MDGKHELTDYQRGILKRCDTGYYKPWTPITGREYTAMLVLEERGYLAENSTDVTAAGRDALGEGEGS